MANQDDLPPDSWDEAEEEALVSRMKTAEIANDTNASEEMLNKALQNPKERSTLLKLDEQFERFLSNPELQHIRFKGVSEKHISMVKCVADLFLLKTSSSGDGSICISKTARSTVPESRFGEPRHVAGRQIKPMEAKPSEQEVKVMRRDVAQRQDDRAARLAAKRGEKKKSAEERQQEYLQARARIFNQQDTADEQVATPPEASSSPTAAYASSSSNGPLGPVQGGMGFSAGRGKREGPLPDQAESKANPQAPRMPKKAVMTNKLADLQDPDYDRSRYGPKPLKYPMSLSAGAQEFLPEREWGNESPQFGMGELPTGIPPPVPHPSMGWPGPLNGMGPSYPMWNMGGWGLQPSIPSHLNFPGDLPFSSNGFPSAFPPPQQLDAKMPAMGMYYQGGAESFSSGSYSNGLQPIGSSDGFSGLDPTSSQVRDYVANGSTNIENSQSEPYHDSSSYQSDFPALG
uniref:SUZ domain-containing protein n=1 Tax=Guillardia theta TaxID=55529 RepID=A0A6U6AEH3_GUITH|mmetsp:Transcript_3151/g.10622  ORF Transcript_3151/g.10622 Transcript_3151/m.10622 type:complete len:460 (+) Transcript_3151:35-1414(+)